MENLKWGLDCRLVISSKPYLLTSASTQAANCIALRWRPSNQGESLITTSQQAQADTFRALHAVNAPILLLPNAWDAASAQLASSRDGVKRNPGKFYP